ncbi:MAG: glycosyltransferase family 4 protein, partial [SAR202 cluster bacterium]|nr:glycosyltransferase family 4 protein [SAR202 cluster bacterium]
FVGRIDPIKGFGILLEMAQILKKKNEFQLIIVGGGSIRSKELIELQSKIDSKNLSDDVVLVGSVPHQQLKTYYSAVDVFVLTSFYESLGFVILESMACATPVVASNVGGIPTLVDDSLTGFLIDENNPESFAEKVEELLIDNNLNYKMGQEGLKKAKLISWTQMTIQMNSFFEKTIN